MQDLNKANSNNKYFLAALAFFIIPISGLSIDIYTPSLPIVAQYFQVENGTVQLTITAYMIGLGIMQIFSGGISDSFGRRLPFLFSMIIYMVASFFIPFVQDIYQLFFLRMVQGVMVSLLVVPMRSVIPDLFHGRDLYKMMNYMVMVWSIGPIIAPAIGAYLQHYFGWRANFYFLGGYGAIAFLLVFWFLPETSQHRHPFNASQIFQRYKTILFHAEFLSSVLIASLLYSIVILFAVISPFIFQNALHFSVVQFGYIALCMGLAWFLGAMTNRFCININLRTKEKFCLTLMFIIILAMLLVHSLWMVTVCTIVIPMFIVIFLGGIVFPNYAARTMALFPTATGSTNALFGSAVFFISALSSAMGSLLKSTSLIPLEIVYLVIIILCGVISQAASKLNLR